MKREDKNLQSRQKIMDAALKEFGEKSYGEASLNTVCKEGEISKGIIYHYFKDKDALFLACVQECFDELTLFLREHMPEEGERAEDVLKQYFDARMEFFQEYPVYLKLFYSAVMTPPPHLTGEIREIRKEFDALNVTVLTRLLENVSLRDNLSIEEVIRFFGLFQDLVNIRYQMEPFGQADIGEHEKMRGQILEILLYGVIERR